MRKPRSKCVVVEQELLECCTNDLMNSFEWADTPQGYEYWMGVLNNLNKILSRHNDACQDEDGDYGECRGCSGSEPLAPIDYLSITKNVLGVPDK